VPTDAFAINIEKPWVTMAAPGDSLASSFSTVPGAVLLNSSIGHACSLGINVNWGGRSAFLTASHCTDYFGSLTNPAFFGQPSNLPVLALEVADPAPFQNTSDCLAARLFDGVDVCRYSDAAVAQLVDSVPNSRLAVGYIARTQALGSPVINQTNPHWEITAARTTNYTGEYVQRMGVATYWVEHQIQSTCVTQFLGMPHSQKAKLWCQMVLQGASQGGDSGGPVFFKWYCGIFLTRPDAPNVLASWA
jgi:hypothetical protein